MEDEMGNEMERKIKWKKENRNVKIKYKADL